MPDRDVNLQHSHPSAVLRGDQSVPLRRERPGDACDRSHTTYGEETLLNCFEGMVPRAGAQQVSGRGGCVASQSLLMARALPVVSFAHQSVLSQSPSRP